MKLLTLVLLISALSSLVVTEVVDSFKVCPQFFFNKQPPTAPKWGVQKKICQRWTNRYMYATLYDTRLRIPVYSAYTFTANVVTVREKYWMNEPQLEMFPKHNKEMEWIGNETILETYTNQAIDKDYANIPYTKGHVYPNLFSVNQDQADSTFTFTNAAPQTEKSNQQWAEQVEDPMHREIIRVCAFSEKNPVYIVTGVVPGNQWIPIIRKQETIKVGINIPSYYWSAYCCKNANGQGQSKAYIGKQNTAQPVPAETMSVNQLNTRLETLYKTKPFTVFGVEC